ncbi:MAG: DUF2232 domain-containing protein [Erysipelotrichales bacterium]|nr:DUF2232 domain-containing protein [Erysipelotrichales bacterium]
MKKTGYITDAAMITAVMAVMLLIDNFAGGFLLVNLAFFLPVPITIYGLKHNYKKAILPAVATVIISLIINWLVGLLYILPSAIVAIVYIIVINKFTSKTGLKIGIMFAGSLIVNILTTVIFSRVLFGYTIVEDSLSLADSMIDIIANLGLSNETINNTLRAIVVSVIPAIVAINSLMEAIIAYLIISILAQRVLKLDIGGNVLALKIKVPSIVTFIFLPLSLISMFFIDKLVNYETFGIVQILVTIGLNILVLLCLAYLIEAVVLSSLYFTRIRKRHLMFVSLLLLLFMPMIFVIVGFIDSVFDLKAKILRK